MQATSMLGGLGSRGAFGNPLSPSNQLLTLNSVGSIHEQVQAHVCLSDELHGRL